MKRILSIILMLMIPIMASAEPDKINIEIGGHKVKLDGNAELYRNSTYVSEDLFARSLGIDVRSENEKDQDISKKMYDEITQQQIKKYGR